MDSLGPLAVRLSYVVHASVPCNPFWPNRSTPPRRATRIPNAAVRCRATTPTRTIPWAHHVVLTRARPCTAQDDHVLEVPRSWNIGRRRGAISREKTAALPHAPAGFGAQTRGGTCGGTGAGKESSQRHCLVPGRLKNSSRTWGQFAD